MKQIDGDIFGGDWDGMVHCANIYHTMGGGIARIIAEKFPQALEADKKTKRSDPKKIGTFSVAHIKPVAQSLSFEIFNLYGQMGMGSDGHPTNRNARYDAIFDGVFAICDYITKGLGSRAYDENRKYVLAFPYKMASDLAGGDWNIVEAILKSVESHFPNIEFEIYKLK